MKYYESSPFTGVQHFNYISWNRYKKPSPQICFPLTHLPPPSEQRKDVELQRRGLLFCSTFFLTCSHFTLDCLIKGVSQFIAPRELNMSSDVPSIFILHASDILPYCFSHELVMSCLWFIHFLFPALLPHSMIWSSAIAVFSFTSEHLWSLCLYCVFNTATLKCICANYCNQIISFKDV